MQWPWIIIILLLLTPPLSLLAGVVRARYGWAPLAASALVIAAYGALLLLILFDIGLKEYAGGGIRQLEGVWFWFLAAFGGFLVAIHAIMLIVGMAAGHSHDAAKKVSHA